MNLFTNWIIDNLDKVSLRLVSDVRTFFHRFFDDVRVLHAVQGHTTGWKEDNGMSERVCQYLISHKDELNHFNDKLVDGLNQAVAGTTTKVTPSVTPEPKTEEVTK